MISMIQREEGLDYTGMLTIIDDIVNEENLHVGQLQQLLKQVSPNASSINQGEVEAREQLNSTADEWVNGKLKVEFHAPRAAMKSQEEPEANPIDDTCTLADADDEW